MCRKPIEAKAKATVLGASGCGSESETNLNNMMLIQEKQTPAADQRIPLSTNRLHSTIPKGSFNPEHQEPGEMFVLIIVFHCFLDSDKWQYPSPQMFFNAMKRKGWNPKEEDVPLVVKIHNTVNERAWSQVIEWEKLHRLFLLLLSLLLSLSLFSCSSSSFLSF
jgi:cytochrome c heme-lyase